MLFLMLGSSILALILMCGKICVILAWTHLLRLFASCIRNFQQSDDSPVMSIILTVIGSIVCLVQSRGLVAVPLCRVVPVLLVEKGKVVEVKLVRRALMSKSGYRKNLMCKLVVVRRLRRRSRKKILILSYIMTPNNLCCDNFVDFCCVLMVLKER